MCGFHPLKFVKKHPWEAAGLAAAAALGGPAIASMVGGGTAASGIAGAGAGLFGASDLTAAMAGDAFMPAALGAGGEGAASTGSLMGAKLASGSGMGKNLLKGAYAANKIGLLGGAQQPMPSVAPQASGPIAPTRLPGVSGGVASGDTMLPGIGGQGSMAGLDPKLLELLKQWQQQQGVS